MSKRPKPKFRVGQVVCYGFDDEYGKVEDCERSEDVSGFDYKLSTGNWYAGEGLRSLTASEKGETRKK